MRGRPHAPRCPACFKLYGHGSRAPFERIFRMPDEPRQRARRGGGSSTIYLVVHAFAGCGHRWWTTHPGIPEATAANLTRGQR